MLVDRKQYKELQKEDAVKVYTVLISHLGKDYDEIPLKDYISGEVNTDVKQ